MATSRVSYLWNDPRAPQEFRTAVSLHSHTNESQETLSSLAKFGSQYALMRHLMAKLERKSETNHGMRANYKAAYWTPPLTPKRAFDLESQQIENLDMTAMVSLTDHDNIRAPQILLVCSVEASSDSSFSGVDRTLRRSVFPPRHPQPARRERLSLDGSSRQLYQQSQ